MADRLNRKDFIRLTSVTRAGFVTGLPAIAGKSPIDSALVSDVDHSNIIS